MRLSAEPRPKGCPCCESTALQLGRCCFSASRRAIWANTSLLHCYILLWGFRFITGIFVLWDFCMKQICPQKLYINLSKYSVNLSKINFYLVYFGFHVSECYQRHKYKLGSFKTVLSVTQSHLQRPCRENLWSICSIILLLLKQLRHSLYKG